MVYRTTVPLVPKPELFGREKREFTLLCNTVHLCITG